MIVEWSPQASGDRDRIFDYIATDNPVAAIELDDKIGELTSALPQHPELYRPGRVRGTREAVVTENYVIIYCMKREHVEILRVLHARQQWPGSKT